MNEPRVSHGPTCANASAVLVVESAFLLRLRKKLE